MGFIFKGGKGDLISGFGIMIIRNPASNLFVQVKILENAGFLISSPAHRGGVFLPNKAGFSQLPKENSPTGKKAYIHIKIYCSFLDKNFRNLIKEYIFFGLRDSETPDFEQYVPGTFYRSVLIYKKK